MVSEYATGMLAFLKLTVLLLLACGIAYLLIKSGVMVAQMLT